MGMNQKQKSTYVKGARLGPDGTVMAQNGTVGGVALSDELCKISPETTKEKKG